MKQTKESELCFHFFQLNTPEKRRQYKEKGRGRGKAPEKETVEEERRNVLTGSREMKESEKGQRKNETN